MTYRVLWTRRSGGYGDANYRCTAYESETEARQDFGRPFSGRFTRVVLQVLAGQRWENVEARTRGY